MGDLLGWILRPENTKPVVLVVFFVTFIAIVLYVYTGRRRTQRLESYKNIPLEEEQGDAALREDQQK